MVFMLWGLHFVTHSLQCYHRNIIVFIIETIKRGKKSLTLLYFVISRSFKTRVRKMVVYIIR